MNRNLNMWIRFFLNVTSGGILLVLFMPETANFFDWFVAALALHWFVRSTIEGTQEDE